MSTITLISKSKQYSWGSTPLLDLFSVNGLDMVRLIRSHYGPSRSLQPTSTPSSAGEGRSLKFLEIPTTEDLTGVVREESQRALAESMYGGVCGWSNNNNKTTREPEELRVPG